FGATDPIATGIVPGSGYSYTIPNSTVPGPYTVTAYFTGDPNFQDGSASVSVTVTPENGFENYVGTHWIATNSQGQATILLTAYVGDDPDGSPGDLRYAKVTFVDRDASTAPMGTCKDVRIDVVDAFNPTTGVATCSYTVTLAKTEDDRSMHVGATVRYSHSVDRPDDDALIMITRAPPGSVSGGGSILGAAPVSMYT